MTFNMKNNLFWSFLPSKTKKNREQLEKCEVFSDSTDKAHLSFESWLKTKKNYKRSCWSYAYDGGILISYYDMGSIPRPEFCNPKPWKN